MADEHERRSRSDACAMLVCRRYACNGKGQQQRAAQAARRQAGGQNARAVKVKLQGDENGQTLQLIGAGLAWLTSSRVLATV